MELTEDILNVLRYKFSNGLLTLCVYSYPVDGGCDKVGGCARMTCSL